MSRLREQAGMTIMEVLTAATIGMIVLMAMFSMLDSTVRLNTGVMSKTDAMQRGRLAMDSMTQELRSQVCLENLTSPAIVADESTATSVTFFSDFSDGDGTQPPTKRELTFDPATGNITTAIYRTAVLEPGPGQFPATPSEINLRLENAALDVDDDDLPIPFLRYFAYEQVIDPVGTPPRPEATLELAPPLDDAAAARVARIDVTFVSRPTGATDGDDGVHLTDRVMARHSDPNLAVPDPKCI